MKILLASYLSNPNIGLFGMATDEFCLLPRGAPKRLQEEISKTLGVPIVCCNIAGTELPGALCIGQGSRLRFSILTSLPLEITLPRLTGRLLWASSIQMMR
jgi:translation initiation factor 6 (eIF-6)